MEMSAVGDIEGMARSLPPPAKVLVTNISIGARSQPAMVQRREDAAQVTLEISTTVRRVRTLLEDSTLSNR
jgi:hypothetical protein